MIKKENRRDSRVSKTNTRAAKETEEKNVFTLFPFRFGHDFRLRHK